MEFRRVLFRSPPPRNPINSGYSNRPGGLHPARSRQGEIDVYDVLEGVKVLEVSAWAFVPSAGGVLADWGAEVVKVEPPDGDPMRGLINAGIESQGPSFPWEVWNRGKRSIALDLRQDRAREIVLGLAEELGRANVGDPV